MCRKSRLNICRFFSPNRMVNHFFFLSLRACIVGMPSDMTYFRLSDPQRLSKDVSHAGMSDNCKHFARKKKIRTDPVNSGPDGRWNVQGRRRSRTRISVGFRSTLPRFESDSGVSCRLSVATFGLPEITFPDAQLLASRGGIQDSKVGGVHLCHDFFFIIIFDKLR